MKTRNSRIELLRIISMVLILLSHTNMITDIFPSRSWFAAPVSVYFFEDMILQLWGGVGDCLFSLITIWFLLEKKANVRKTASLYGKVWLLCIIFYFVDKTFVHSLSLEESLQSIVRPFTSQYWYLVYYLMLVVSIPAAKCLLDYLSKEAHFGIILISTILLFWRTTFIAGEIGFMFNYCTGLYLTVVAYYVMKYGWESPFNKLRYCLLALILMIFYIMFYNYMFYKTYDFNYCSFANQQFCFTAFWPVYIGLFIFFYTVNAKPFYSKAINWVGKNVLGIYIFSCSLFGKAFIMTHLALTGRSPITYIPKVLIADAIIAVFSVLAWSLYSFIWDSIFKLIGNGKK